jgi:hypothetical protein
VPLAYQHDPNSRIVTLTGDYAAAAEWKDLLAKVASDCRRADGHRNPAVVKQVWDVLGAYRAAIVTRRGIDLPASVAHALAEMEGIPLRAFSSYDDAIKWLNAS